MGGTKEKPIIGFKYFLGIHAVLAHNKLNILGLKFGEKSAWGGVRGGGETISVNNKELFGGESAEGGVSGRVDVLDGDSAQGKNSYLNSKISGVISAYRGVTSLVFRQFYFGNNPYLKRLAIKGIDNEIRHAWYPEKALLNIDTKVVKAEIYIALDNSLSMLIGSRHLYQRVAVKSFLAGLKGTTNSIRIVSYNVTVQESITIRNCDNDDYDTLMAWVSAMGAPLFGTDYDAGVSLASSFFTTAVATELEGSGILEDSGDTGSAATENAQRLVMFISDGQAVPASSATDAAATLATIDRVEVYCYSIDLTDTTHLELLDNTPADGVPILSAATNGALLDALQAPFTSWADINASHVLRDAIVYAHGGDDTVVGDSFTAFADTCYEEGMGVSLLWRDTSSYNEFMDKVKAHADCVTYPDRTTGKMEVKAIRDDYDVGTLFVYDTSNVTKWHEDIAAPLQRTLPNQLTVVYTKRSDGSTASITAANIAAVQQVGRLISADPLTYEGFTTDDIAAKVLTRDLSARTVPLTVGTIDVAYAPVDLNLGTPFILNNPRIGLNSMVVRLTSKSETPGIKPRITLKFVEDKFAIPTTAFIVPDAPVVANKAPVDAAYRLFAELGYYPLVIAQTQPVIDDLLTTDADYGAVALAGSKPNNWHSSMDSATNNGSGWVLIGSGGFMPASVMVDTLSDSGVTSFDIVNNDGLRQVVAGTLLIIDAEIMRVDNMVIVGDNVSMTVGRGCLDTVPTSHTTGTAVLFYDGFAQVDPTLYVAGETIDGKVLTKTSDGRLPLDDATTEQVTLDSRAIRPYPVGNLKMDGDFHLTGTMDETVTLTWAHRDRTLQITSTVEDYTAANIGPETGVAYSVLVYAVLEYDNFFAQTDFFAEADFFVDESNTVLINTTAVAQVVTYDYDSTDEPDFFDPTDFFTPTDFFGVIGGEAMRTRIDVSVARDGYDNYQVSTVSGKHFMAPSNLTGEGY